MIRIRTLALAGALALSTATALALDYKAGDLEIDHPWSRATPAAAPVGAGYMTITNKGTTADRLISGTSDVSAKVEIHEMAVVDGVMRMRALDKGIDIPAGGKVEFKPGGYHIMLIGLKRPITKESGFKGTLTFEKAGTVEIEYEVESMGKAPAGHSGH